MNIAKVTTYCCPGCSGYFWDERILCDYKLRVSDQILNGHFYSYKTVSNHSPTWQLFSCFTSVRGQILFKQWLFISTRVVALNKAWTVISHILILIIIYKIVIFFLSMKQKNQKHLHLETPVRFLPNLMKELYWNVVQQDGQNQISRGSEMVKMYLT